MKRREAKRRRYWENPERAREVARLSYARNREKRRASERRRYERTRELALERARRWYQDNRERALQYRRRWREQNRERKRELDRRWREQNRERRRETKRRWREKNPDAWRALQRLAMARRRARLRNALVIAFTREQLMQRMAYWGNRCWVCGGPFEEIDHVIAIARGGPHCLANLRPICRSCNASKQDRDWRHLEEPMRDAG